MELCQVAVGAVAHYVQTHGLQMLSSRLEGHEEWPVLPDSTEPGAQPEVVPMEVDDGYIPRRAQEWLLSGPVCGGGARQYAAMLGAQLAAHFRR